MAIGISEIIAAIRLAIEAVPKLVKKKERSAGAAFFVPAYGWREIGTMEYEGVIWPIYTERESPHRTTLERIYSDDDTDERRIEVSSTAICPNNDCRVALEEQERHWYQHSKFKWICVGCGFEKLSKMSMYNTSIRAQRIAQVKFRR
jgi:hypothetical protein